jgi:hypothetical protein
MPAQAGTQGTHDAAVLRSTWVPTFVGMTVVDLVDEVR